MPYPESLRWEHASQGKGQNEGWHDWRTASEAAVGGSEFEREAGRSILQARHGSELHSQCNGKEALKTLSWERGHHDATCII